MVASKHIWKVALYVALLCGAVASEWLWVTCLGLAAVFGYRLSENPLLRWLATLLPLVVIVARLLLYPRPEPLW